jgi:protein-tyrosine phosphatase
VDLFPITGPWPGRLAVCSRPRSGGWLEDDIRILRREGFGTLISAVTTEELANLFLQEVPDICLRHEIAWVHFPIGNLQVPSVDSALPALQSWARLLDAGHGVAVHCWGSVGRSPTLAASLLVLRGLDAAEAWDRVQLARGREVPDTLEQRRWVEHFAMLTGPPPGAGSPQSPD